MVPAQSVLASPAWQFAEVKAYALLPSVIARKRDREERRKCAACKRARSNRKKRTKAKAKAEAPPENGTLQQDCQDTEGAAGAQSPASSEDEGLDVSLF